MRSAGAPGAIALAIALAGCGASGSVWSDTEWGQPVVIGQPVRVNFGWAEVCTHSFEGHGRNEGGFASYACNTEEASITVACSRPCEVQGPGMSSDLGAITVWPKQLGALAITATVQRLSTGARKTRSFDVEVVQPQILLCPSGREPEEPVPGTRCTARPKVVVAADDPEAKIRLLVTRPSRWIQRQLEGNSRELRANGQPLGGGPLDLRKLFPDRVRGTGMAPGEYPVVLALGPQQVAVTIVVEAAPAASPAADRGAPGAPGADRLRPERSRSGPGGPG
jgi:hypothetical protein